MQQDEALAIISKADEICVNESISGGNYELFYHCKMDYFKQHAENDWLVYLDDVENEMFRMNIILRTTFGILGAILAMFVIILISRVKELRTQFGIICASIGICDIMVFIYMVLIELIYDLGEKNPYLVSPYSCPDIEAPFYLFGIRIDLITYYLGACGLSTCVFYGSFKSLQRFLALSAPLFYDHYLTMRNTIKVCIIYAVIIHIGFLPILINKSVDIRYIYGRYLFGAVNSYSLYKTSIIVKYIREYFDYGNFILSIFFDIGTAIMLYRYHRKNSTEWSHQRATLEKLFLLQNFFNVLTCLVLLASYVMFVFVCRSGGQYCLDSFIKRFLRMLYNYDCSKIIWRSFDEMITFIFQFRAYLIYKNGSSAPVISITS